MSKLNSGGWAQVNLGDLVSLQRGYDLPKSLRTNGSVPVVGSGGTTGYHDTAMVRGPGVTIGRAANLGVPTLVENDFWPLNTTLFVSDFRGSDVRFTYYLFKAINLTAYNSGSVQPMLNRNYIRNYPLVVPGLSEQQEIGKILGALDDKIYANGQASFLALQIVESRYARFRYELLKSPRISIAELSASGQLEYGDGYRTKHAEHGRPGIPILRVAEVLDGRIDPGCTDYVHENFRSSMRSKTSRPGDIVLTTKGTVGRVAIVPEKFPELVYSPQLCYFRVNPRSPFSSYFFFSWLRSQEFRRQARGMQSQTDMADYLSLSDIGSLKINLPDRNVESTESEKARTLWEVAESRNRENEVLRELRDALLPKLISGELRIRDAERQVEDAV